MRKKNQALGKRKPVDHEHQEQRALFKWADAAMMAYPDLSEMYAVPNGGKRHPSVARKMKAEGVRPGRPDINLDVGRLGYNGLRAELKTPATGGRTKGVLSKHQIDCLQRASQQGYLAFTGWGWESIKDVVVLYLNNELTEEYFGSRPDLRLF